MQQAQVNGNREEECASAVGLAAVVFVGVVSVRLAIHRQQPHCSTRYHVSEGRRRTHAHTRTHTLS